MFCLLHGLLVVHLNTNVTVSRQKIYIYVINYISDMKLFLNGFMSFICFPFYTYFFNTISFKNTYVTYSCFIEP
jgi:hypothetical protein